MTLIFLIFLSEIKAQKKVSGIYIYLVYIYANVRQKFLTFFFVTFMLLIFYRLGSITEKDSAGFLRMGSLNVKVKKTTEVVSNFLGVGNHNHPDKLHKMWSSADNIEVLTLFI